MEIDYNEMQQRINKVLEVYGRSDISRARIKELHRQISRLNGRLARQDEPSEHRQAAVTLHKVSAGALSVLKFEYNRVALRRRFGEKLLKDERDV